MKQFYKDLLNIKIDNIKDIMNLSNKKLVDEKPQIKINSVCLNI